MSINVTVWNENRHEQTHAEIRALYPNGIHGAVAEAIRERGDVSVATATLDEPEHGLTVERLAQTDVLFWWGHAAHGEVTMVIRPLGTPDVGDGSTQIAEAPAV